MSDSDIPRPPKNPHGVRLSLHGYSDEVKAAARAGYLAALRVGNGRAARRLARRACNIAIPLRTVARWCENWDDDEDVKAAAAVGRAKVLEQLEAMSVDVAVSMHKMAVDPKQEPKTRTLASRVVIGAWGTKLRDGQPAGGEAGPAKVDIQIVYPEGVTKPDDDPKDPEGE